MTTGTIPITTIKFAEIKLQPRDAHKLRGYFGNLFREHSPVLHNHYDSGEFRYQYPEVQYKVLNNVPTLIGVKEGAGLLPQLFLKIKEIDIDGHLYEVNTKNISSRQSTVGFSDSLHEYKFQTLWMALNQHNYTKYQRLKSGEEKNKMLNRILVGHILGFFRSVGVELSDQERVMTKVSVKQKSTNFKENKMIAFSGSFVANVNIPGDIGLGKSVSRGFGTIKRA